VTDDFDPKYKLKRLSDYEVIPSTEWLIEKYLPLGSKAILFALPKKLKTYIGLSWACCVATGRDWLEFPTKKGRVLYIALEGYFGVLRRQEAWRIRHKVSKAELNDLAFLRCAMNFASDQSVREVLRAIVDGQRFRPDLIIIDTLFSSLPGVNVSDQKEMTLALERIEFVQKTLEAVAEFSDALAAVTIVVIAHTTKDGASLFGTVAIPAIFDVMIKVEREAKAREAILHYTEARDIEEPPSTKVVLEEVEIDTRSGKEKNLAVTELGEIKTDEGSEKINKKTALDDARVEAWHILSVVERIRYKDWRDQTKAAIKAKYKRGLGNTVFSAAVQSFVDQGAVLRIEESSREVWYQVARPKAAKAVSAAHGDPKLGPEGPEGPESAPLGGGTLGTRTVRSGMSPGLSGPMQLKRVSRL